MQDVLSRLSRMRRPALLMEAAQIGAADYRRERRLRRYFGLSALPGPGEALVKLMEIEGWQDDCRRSGDAAYSAIRHVDAMIAVLGEAALLAAAREASSPPAPNLR